MKFIQTCVAGAWIIEPEPRIDDRGFFARVWDHNEFAARGLSMAFVQCNNSGSRWKGTIRGLHWQESPFAEIKLVRCTRGAVFDVVADVRPDSPTFGRWAGVELSADNRLWLYVPQLCAHGYMSLEDGSEVIYAVTAPYHPSAERGIRYNDPYFAIRWPNVGEILVSEKDRSWPDFKVSQ